MFQSKKHFKKFLFCNFLLLLLILHLFLMKETRLRIPREWILLFMHRINNRICMDHYWDLCYEQFGGYKSIIQFSTSACVLATLEASFLDMDTFCDTEIILLYSAKHISTWLYCQRHNSALLPSLPFLTSWVSKLKIQGFVSKSFQRNNLCSPVTPAPLQTLESSSVELAGAV